MDQKDKLFLNFLSSPPYARKTRVLLEDFKHRIIFALASGQKEKVIELLENIRKKNSRGEALRYYNAAFHICLQQKATELIEFILSKNVIDLNGAETKASSPLFTAIHLGDPEIVKLLIKYGANVNMCVEETYPIHTSTRWNHLEITKILVENGAKVNVYDRDRLTPLHYAAMVKNKDMIELLIKAGAIVDARGKNEMTPLHVAVYQGCLECVILLIEAGADVSALTKDGKTPLDIAHMRSHKTIETYLRALGSSATGLQM